MSNRASLSMINSMEWSPLPTQVRRLQRSAAQGADLNRMTETPGPFNDTTTGACRNIDQIKFTVAGISTNELRLPRSKKRNGC